MREALALALAFLAGSVPFGVILVRLFRGVDVRTVGSGNIGATNALRAGGAGIGVAVLVLDIVKGIAGVVAGRWAGGPDAATWLLGGLLVAAVAGHVFSPWLGFAGGKGYATFLGALLVGDPAVLGLTLLAFAGVALPARMVSAGSIVSSLAAGTAAFALGRHGALPWAIVAAGLLVVLRHHENVRRILAGTEPRLGQKRAPEAAESAVDPRRERRDGTTT